MDGVPDHDALAQYHAARDAVGIADRSDLGVVEVTGRDRAKFLHALLSNDIAALAARRIEAGTPRFGEDVDATVLLPEIPSAHLISNTKGCYPGQEVVVRIRDRGHVNRYLRGLLLESDVVPPRGAEVVVGDAVVGQVTSATLSLGLRRPIALAFIKRQQEPGARVNVRAGADTL